MKWGASTTGRKCDACGKTDTEADPVEPQHTRLWGRYVRDTSITSHVALKTDGSTCWYDIRVHDVCYREQYNLTQWKAERTKDGK